MYIPGASEPRPLILVVFPAPEETDFLVSRIRLPVMEVRLISILPERLESNNRVKESLNGFGYTLDLVSFLTLIPA